MVGTSGSSGERFFIETASAFRRPDFTCGTAFGGLVNIMSIWPPTRSLIDWPTPLYGTCRMSIFAIDFSSSPARCGGAPTPDDA